MDIINDIQSNYSTGYIKLFRSLKHKGWFKKSDYVHLWIYILIQAAHKQSEFFFNGNNVILEPGQFITGRKIISSDTGINESKIERILNFFEKNEHQIEQQKTNRNRLITVLTWEQYQQREQQNEQPVNNKRTTNEQPVNTYKNVKNDKNAKNVNKEEYIGKIQKQFYQSLTPFIDNFDAKELRKFYDYWSEPNKSKTKIKWQLERTWDTKKRLDRWMNNVGTNINKQSWNEKTPKAI